MVAGWPHWAPSWTPKWPIPEDSKNTLHQAQEKARDSLFAALTAGVGTVAAGPGADAALLKRESIAQASVSGMIELAIREGVYIPETELRTEIVNWMGVITTWGLAAITTDQQRVEVMEALVKAIKAKLTEQGVPDFVFKNYLTNALRYADPKWRIKFLTNEVKRRETAMKGRMDEMSDMYEAMLANPKIWSKKLAGIISVYQSEPDLQFDVNKNSTDPIKFLERIMMRCDTDPWRKVRKYIFTKKMKPLVIGKKMRDGLQGEIQWVIDYFRVEFDEAKFADYPNQPKEVTIQKKAIMRKLEQAWVLMKRKYQSSDEPDFTV